MSLNPVITLLGRRLRLAVIGGGEGSFIGPLHRLAARLDDPEAACRVLVRRIEYHRAVDDHPALQAAVDALERRAQSMGSNTIYLWDYWEGAIGNDAFWEAIDHTHRLGARTPPNLSAIDSLRSAAA